jgi:hypothetical protein
MNKGHCIEGVPEIIVAIIRDPYLPGCSRPPQGRRPLTARARTFNFTGPREGIVESTASWSRTRS